MKGRDRERRQRAVMLDAMGRIGVLAPWSALLVLLAHTVPSPAYPRAYGPFAPGTEPQKVPLHECVRIREEMEPDGPRPHAVYYAIAKQGTSPVVKLESFNEGLRITLQDAKGSSLLTAPTVDHDLTLLHQVKSADLNGDGSPDSIVSIWSGGCGLGGEISTVVFLLSRGGKYEATSFDTFDFDQDDIVRLRRGGPCYFIHSGFLGNDEERTKDGRVHNFWVYQLYRLDGFRPVLANEDDKRFPKWVWYTFRENHQETDQLTKEQKRRILAKQPTTLPAH